ncbi:MAG: hypothetical protein ACRDPY_13300 [Streptosporangiaceae bacterium]
MSSRHAGVRTPPGSAAGMAGLVPAEVLERARRARSGRPGLPGAAGEPAAPWQGAGYRMSACGDCGSPVILAGAGVAVHVSRPARRCDPRNTPGYVAAGVGLAGAQRRRS